MPSSTTVTQFIPTRHDLKLYAGDGAQVRLELTSPAIPPDPPAPFPIVGTIEAQIRAKRLDPVILTTFFTVEDDFDEGIIVLSLTGAQTQELIEHATQRDGTFSGVWDVQWTPEAAEPVTLVQGSVTASPDVTREPEPSP